MNRNIVETIGLALLLVLMAVGVVVFRPFSRNQAEVANTPTQVRSMAGELRNSISSLDRPTADNQSQPDNTQQVGSAVPRTAGDRPVAPVQRENTRTPLGAAIDSTLNNPGLNQLIAPLTDVTAEASTLLGQ
jgi:hypothetical protein